MRAPDFWDATSPTWPARLLAPLGWLYGAATAWRMGRPGLRLPVPVICIGNLTLGGAGKTPTALLVAQRLIAMGERPVLLSRGYGGSLQGPVRVDRAVHAAKQVGDEPLLLAEVAPVIVARDRPAGARLALEQGASVIVMDDGLQNPSLAKTLALAVIDGAGGVGNGLAFPAGPLRAPVAAQAPFVTASLVIGHGEAGREAARRLARPMLTGRLSPDPSVAARLKGRRVLAMAGIGRPRKFLDTLQACGATIVGSHLVGDHEPYRQADLDMLAARAAHDDLAIVTTAKDRVRLIEAPPAFLDRLIVLPVTLELDDPDALDALLASALHPA